MADPLKYRARPSEFLSITVPPELKDALTKYATKGHMSTSALARELIRSGVVHLDKRVGDDGG